MYISIYMIVKLLFLMPYMWKDAYPGGTIAIFFYFWFWREFCPVDVVDSRPSLVVSYLEACIF